MPKIIIQAGHEGRTTGATGAPGEQAHNTYVSNKLAERLRSKGFEVIRVNADPTNAQLAGDWDLFFSIHYDADIYGSGGGFFDRPAVDGAAERSKAILEALESKYFPITGIVNKPGRRNNNTANYYMWNRLSSKTPCVIVECGVGMHKPDDYEILQNNRDLEVEGLYQGMLKAFNMDGGTTTNPPSGGQTMSETNNFLGCANDAEAKAKLIEHLGQRDGKCDWGNASSSDTGGYLGSARRDVTRLSSEVDQLKKTNTSLVAQVTKLEAELEKTQNALSQCQSQTSPETEWEANGLTIEETTIENGTTKKVITNYKLKV